MQWLAFLPAIIGTGLLVAGCGFSRPQAPAAPAAPSVANGPIQLRDVAEQSGLNFQWGHNGRTPLTALESFGCGCAFFDYDRDGWQDIFLVGEPRCGLFRNLGNGRFADVSESVGLGRMTALWKGVAAGDINGDGWPDLVITGFHRTVVLTNDRGKRFTDATRTSGIRNTGWGGSAGMADLDADGDLDLYIANYVVFGPREKQYCELAPGVRSGCPPQTYRAERGALFRNDGNGRFTDISETSGIRRSNGKSLVVGFCDYDEDGRTDIYVGNDGTPADLFRNEGSLRFRNAGLESGVALSRGGTALAAMGIDWGDVDRDGRLDAAVSAFSNESFALFRNLGGIFSDEAIQAGIAEPTFLPLGFGTRFVDLDNDGWLDLVFACGHVYDAASQIDPRTTFRQPTMVFHNRGGWRFEDVTATTGDACTRPIVGRGLASADYDKDGRVDLLVVDYEGRPLLLHNESDTTNRWLQIAATGPAGNPLGYGCQITVDADGKPRRFQMTPVNSYLSSSEPLVHVGLGSGERVRSVRAVWPDGRKTTLREPPVNQRITVRYPG